MSPTARIVLIVAGVLLSLPIAACAGCLMFGAMIDASISPEQRERMRTQSRQQTETSAANSTSQWGNRFGQKTDDTGTLVVYTLDDHEWNEDEFKKLCLSEKKWAGDGFRCVAVFNKRENAKYPNNPISAMYGMDTNAMRNIVATYECTGFNSFSEATIYQPNGTAKRLKL